MSGLGRGRWGGHRGGWGRHGGRFWGGGGGWYPPVVQTVVIPCACPDVYAPVIATDGITYDNACLARCNGAIVIGRVQNVPEVIVRGRRGG